MAPDTFSALTVLTHKDLIAHVMRYTCRRQAARLRAVCRALNSALRELEASHRFQRPDSGTVSFSQRCLYCCRLFVASGSSCKVLELDPSTGALHGCTHRAFK